MVYLIEKLQYVLSGLIIFLIVLFYFILGGPDASGGLPIEVREERTTSVTLPIVDNPPSQAHSNNKKTPVFKTNQKIDPKLKKVSTNLKKLGFRGIRKIDVKEYKVNRETVKYLHNRRNIIGELNNASSKIMKDAAGNPTMIQLYDITEGSLFEKFGIQDGDILSLVDGNIGEFTASNSYEHWDQATNMLEKLGQGENISITVMRGGRPVQLEFGLR